MNWGPQQKRALDQVGSWLRNPRQPIFRLFGYAGTGKTTLARHLAQGVSGEVRFAAFTGKAASVLKASGAHNAQTLHSLIYTPKEQSRERLRDLKQELEDVQFMVAERRAEEPPDWPGDPKLNDRLERLRKEVQVEEQNARRPHFSLNMESPLRDASLLVVDEVSMVGEEMAEDILSFGVPVLALGDPAQLPPVKGTGYFTDAQPDAMLTEIHRQARDNPIIDLATRIRNGEPLPLGQYGSSSVIERATPELAMDADQVIVGKNKTRAATNRRMRQLLGREAPLPLAGERLVCLRNDKDLGLLNGTLHVTTADARDEYGRVALRIRPEEDPGAEPIAVEAHREHFDGDPDSIGYWDRLDAQEFAFGYALTCHKSQGSQWPHVLIIDESAVFRQRDVQRKWLYTAVTRAQERVTVVRG